MTIAATCISYFNSRTFKSKRRIRKKWNYGL